MPRRRRRSASARGYGSEHKARKRHWQTVIDRGPVLCHALVCLEPSRVIPQGTPGRDWHLGHTPDRTRWTGPEHPRCNTSEGASRGNTARGKAKGQRATYVYLDETTDIRRAAAAMEMDAAAPEALEFFDD